MLCQRSRDIFLSQPILVEMEVRPAVWPCRSVVCLCVCTRAVELGGKGGPVRLFPQAKPPIIDSSRGGGP